MASIINSAVLSHFDKMYFIFFAFLCILGPDISSARTYLIVDVDALRNLQLDYRIARRNTPNDENGILSKDYIKTALNFLKSYDEDDLNNAFQYFKNQLADINVQDQTLNIAKHFVLNKLDEVKGKPGKQIKNLIDVLSQNLGNGNGNIEMRARDNEKIGRLVSKFWDETTPLRSKADNPITLVDTIKTAFHTFAGILLNRNGPNRKPGRSEKNGVEDLFMQLVKLFKDYQDKGTFNERDLDKLSKLYDEYKRKNNRPGKKSPSEHPVDNTKYPIGHFSKLFEEREKNENTDWTSLISKFMTEMENNHSIDWLQTLWQNMMHNEKAWEGLNQYKHKKHKTSRFGEDKLYLSD